jgi:hypothetical protein
MIRRRHFEDAVRALAVGVLVLSLANCDEEKKNAPVDPGPLPPGTLHYDSGNLSAPSLAAGTYEAGARFTSTQIGTMAGRKLIEVRYFIFTPAEVCSVKVYGPSSASEPGAALYAADVTNDAQGNQWNTHTLAQPVTLASTDLWICVEFSNSVGQPTVGCDPGPAVQDGDWLHSSADGEWKPLSQRFGISINWNIRGIVE